MQYYDVTNTSLVKVPSSIVEAYIPLWLADGTTVGTGATSAGATNSYMQDGGNFAGAPSSSTTLLTLSSSWDASKKYAFEVSMYTSATATASAALWDYTSSAIVSGATVTTASTTLIVLRSGQLTLIPGHNYGVVAWNSVGGSTSTRPASASLIVFG